MRLENMLRWPLKIKRVRLTKNALLNRLISIRQLLEIARSVILTARMTSRAIRYSGVAMLMLLM
jgi:adenylate cyclase